MLGERADGQPDGGNSLWYRGLGDPSQWSGHPSAEGGQVGLARRHLGVQHAAEYPVGEALTGLYYGGRQSSAALASCLRSVPTRARAWCWWTALTQ